MNIHIKKIANAWAIVADGKIRDGLSDEDVVGVVAQLMLEREPKKFHRVADWLQDSSVPLSRHQDLIMAFDLDTSGKWNDPCRAWSAALAATSNARSVINSAIYSQETTSEKGKLFASAASLALHAISATNEMFKAAVANHRDGNANKETIQ